jgi:DUF971 family protein
VNDAEITTIDVERDRALHLSWSDGFSGSIPVDALRALCPCAGCRGVRERGDTPWPPSGRTIGVAATIADAELVGAWGISIRWHDGHDTGIYPWDSLRRIIESSDHDGSTDTR